MRVFELSGMLHLLIGFEFAASVLAEITKNCHVRRRMSVKDKTITGSFASHPPFFHDLDGFFNLYSGNDVMRASVLFIIFCQLLFRSADLAVLSNDTFSAKVIFPATKTYIIMQMLTRVSFDPGMFGSIGLILNFFLTRLKLTRSAHQSRI